VIISLGKLMSLPGPEW